MSTDLGLSLPGRRDTIFFAQKYHPLVKPRTQGSVLPGGALALTYTRPRAGRAPGDIGLDTSYRATTASPVSLQPAGVAEVSSRPQPVPGSEDSHGGTEQRKSELKPGWGGEGSRNDSGRLWSSCAVLRTPRGKPAPGVHLTPHPVSVRRAVGLGQAWPPLQLSLP